MKAQMKTHNWHILPALLAAACLLVLDRPASGQNATVASRPTGSPKTGSTILYHNGPVMPGTADLYVIWYGCWTDTCGDNGDTFTQSIVLDFLTSIGGSPYFQINSRYPNDRGQAPSGGLIYGGSVEDHYSYGNDLTVSDIQGILHDHLENGSFPEDPVGIYIVIASADVSSTASGFCVPLTHPHHGTFYALGIPQRYAFIGNPAQCPSVAAPQFMSNGTSLPTPNGSLSADAMASTLAHVLSTVVTDPSGSGWYDRYGLENADKCEGQFGQTYLTGDGAQANIKLGQRNWLIQENWVNIDRKAHCALNSSQ